MADENASLQVRWGEAPLEEVMAFFVRGYRLKDGERLESYQSFIDPTKGVVIVKMYVATGEPVADKPVGDDGNV